MPTEAEAASFGLTVDEASGPPVEVWPDNIPAVNVFISMSTQWRSSGFGATGLDYAALPAVLRLTKVPRAQWSDVFDGLRVMEEQALQMMQAMRGKRG